MAWVKNFPQLYYRAKAVYAAVILLVGGVSAVLADKAVSVDELPPLILLVTGLLTALGVHQVENGPAPSSGMGVRVPDVQNPPQAY